MSDDLPYKIEFNKVQPLSPNNDGKEWQEYRIVDKDTNAKSTPIKSQGTRDEISDNVAEIMDNRATSLMLNSSGGKNKKRWKRGKGINLPNRKTASGRSTEFDKDAL